MNRNLVITLVAALAGLLTGCQSFNNPPSESLTSVTITNHTLAEVQKAVVAVMTAHYFTGGPVGPNTLVFNRPGSRMNDLAYGDYVFKEMVTVKVQVTTELLPDKSIRVGCNAWMVEADDDSVFQDEHKVRSLRKWPYEKLLKDIKAQLGE